MAACGAACELWPEAMAAAPDILLGEAGVRQSWVEYDWSRYLEPADDDSLLDDGAGAAPPTWLLQKLKQLLCVCDAAWELVLLARLCVDEAVACRANRAKGRAGARPLTVGEVDANWADECVGLRETLLARFGRSLEELQAALTTAWPRHCVWSSFHLDVLEIVCAAAADGAIGKSVFVVTSRDQRSAVVALQAAGAALQERRRERGLPPGKGPPEPEKDGWRLKCGLAVPEERADAVQQICAEHAGLGGAGAIVVDDSVSFLRECASRLSLGGARLYLADWGYVSRGRWSDARAGLPRVLDLIDAEALRRALVAPHMN